MRYAYALKVVGGNGYLREEQFSSERKAKAAKREANAEGFWADYEIITLETLGEAKAAPKDWQCQECGKLMTLKQAERAFSNVQGCPKCGGADIDLVSSVRTVME